MTVLKPPFIRKYYMVVNKNGYPITMNSPKYQPQLPIFYKLKDAKYIAELWNAKIRYVFI